MEGFYDIIPKRLISIFNEQELELLISGLPNVDIEDLKANTEYHKYTATSLQVHFNFLYFILCLKELNHSVFSFFFPSRFNGSGVHYEVLIKQIVRSSYNSLLVRLKCRYKVSLR